MSTTIPIFAIIFLNIVVNSRFCESVHEFEYNKLKFDASREIINTLRTVLGLPYRWNDGNLKPLLSEAEVQEMLDDNQSKDPSNLEYHGTDFCARDLARMALSVNEEWAKLMIDADGKPPPAIMYGHASWIGSYRECLAAEAPPDPLNNNRSDTTFAGKYCTLTWSANISKVLPLTQGNIGLCVPDTCEESDFVNINKSQQVFMRPNIMPQLRAVTNSSISVQSVTCQPKTTTYTSGAIAVLVIIYIFVFLVLAGTALTVIEALFPISPNSCQESDSRKLPINATLENGLSESVNVVETESSEISTNLADTVTLIENPKRGTIISHVEGFLKCFCLITNGAKILDTTDKGGSELRCIHGIRFLSMAWVILGHTYAFSMMSTFLGNIVDVLNIIDNPAFQAILEGTYSVDSFFVMSGFLLTHIFLREMTAREGKMSWLAFYLHRFWRLTPVYMIVLGFDTMVSVYLIDGPFRPVSVDENCKKTWWWNLLYINNFVNQSDQCMGWAWYLANDMQFYVISPLFLYPLWRWPKLGLGLIAILFETSLLSTFAISYHFDVVAAYTYIPKLTEIAPWLAKTALYFDKIYVKPYTRINPYLIGVVAAFLLFQLKGRKKFLTRTFQILGWAISTGFGLLLIFGLYDVQPSRVGTAFYNALNRSIYSACLAWVMFACLTGHGDAVNKILSHSLFIPLGRLTYCAYLVHPIVMNTYFLSLPTTLIMTHLQMVMLFFGFLVLSYGAALVTSLLFESPTMAIERFLRKTLTKTS